MLINVQLQYIKYIPQKVPGEMHLITCQLRCLLLNVHGKEGAAMLVTRVQLHVKHCLHDLEMFFYYVPLPW